MPVNDTQHGGNQVDGEDIVGIGKEANARNDDSSYMVPAKGSLVDFGESKSSTLVGVGDMGIVVVEVVEGSIAAGSLLSHCGFAPGCVVSAGRGRTSQQGDWG